MKKSKSQSSAAAIALYMVRESAWSSHAKSLAPEQRQWCTTHAFCAKPETSLLLPATAATPMIALVGVRAPFGIWAIAHAAQQLPKGSYQLQADASLSEQTIEDMALGFALAQYQFTRYKTADAKGVELMLPSPAIHARVQKRYETHALVRDLINTPTNDMSPQDIARAAKSLARSIKAECTVITGDALLKHNYPAIHAVGRASATPPCLIDMRWGKPSHPRVTLVGKGVCFDTGGLDLKPYSSMKLMKKDMGGAALVLGLAHAIAVEKLPIRLRVLIPAVENAVSGNAFRPQDVIATRKGLSLEIGSTDAEGRVILCDALTEADSEAPDIIIDVATLTGAARTALGTEIPALFSLRSDEGDKLVALSMQQHDPLWQLPLWEGYDRHLKSPVADITNTPNYGYAGSITAALFLRRFVGQCRDWFHIDTMAWNIESLPGRPAGGEALGLRALLAYLKKRYGA